MNGIEPQRCEQVVCNDSEPARKSEDAGDDHQIHEVRDQTCDEPGGPALKDVKLGRLAHSPSKTGFGGSEAMSRPKILRKIPSVKPSAAAPVSRTS